MTQSPTASLCTASLKAYLQALQESGMDGIPVTVAGGAPLLPEAALPAAPGISAENQHDTLDKIRKDLQSCQRCGLGKKKKNLVFGAGASNARLLFIGEGPEAEEDTKGEPFVGEAGGILTRIITAMGLKREDIYICNVMKCCLPENRDLETEEIAACAPFLLRQIRSIHPEVIVALGKCAADTLLNIKEPISKSRGKFHDYNGIPLMPTYPPSYLLQQQKQGNLTSFWDVWDDMTQVLRLLKLPVPEKSRKK